MRLWSALPTSVFMMIIGYYTVLLCSMVRGVANDG